MNNSDTSWSVNVARRPPISEDSSATSNHRSVTDHTTPTPQSPLYRQLDQQNQEIRLLEVLPALNDGRIECELSSGYLKTANYVVLSYRWGTLAAEHEIVINGHSFFVRRNLWDFLNVIREQPGMFFWIDALCINQNDLEERNQQVRVMGQIFQSASMVLSWLGAANAQVELAFDLMSKVWSSSPNEDESDRLPVIHPGQSEDDLWRCIAELCVYPYWGRVWVVQEILLSTNNYLLCGRKTLPWQVFANFISLVDVRFACPPEYSRIIHNSTAKSYAMSKPYVMVPQSLQWRVGNALKHDFGKAWDVKEHNLFRILTMFGDRDCTDPLDHVYALLSLTDEGSMFPIQYGIAKIDLFLSVLHFCGQSASQEGEQSTPLILVQNSQRAFIRNSKHIAEILEISPAAVQKTQPYYYGSGLDMRGPSPRPNACFPREDQAVVLQCSTIVPGNEPPILRSNTLKRSISSIPFNQILYIHESTSWLLCQQPKDLPNLSIVGVITVKDSPQGRGFRILEPGQLVSGIFECSLDGSWSLHVPPEAHLHLLKIIVLGQQPD